MAEADVLIATPLDFDPIGVIELDSAFHDTPPIFTPPDQYSLAHTGSLTGATQTVSYGLQTFFKTFIMQAMTDNIRLPDELGRQLRARREALGLSKSALAEKAGKVREVVYRLEAGEDTTVSSLLAVMGALGLVLRFERAGLPSASEVAARFMEEDDDAP